MNEVLNKEFVDEQYAKLGFDKGWAFLACREERLDDAEVVIVGLNPGGGRDDYEYTGVWSCDNNSFTNDDSEVRDQVREWHRLLDLDPEETLCAQFVPFRSPGWEELGPKAQANAVARKLWAAVLERSPASLYLVMGQHAAWYIADLMGARQIAWDLPVNWRGAGLDVWEDERGRRVVALPHPSRYRIFGRGDGSREAERSFRAAAGREDIDEGS